MILLLSLLINVSFSAEKLVVYTYDSLKAKWGIGPHIESIAKKKLGVKIEWVPFATAGEAVNQLSLEKKKTRADVVLGVDALLSEKLLGTGLIDCSSTAKNTSIAQENWLDSKGCIVPLDVGYLAFVFDKSRKDLSGIHSFSELADAKELHKKIVIPSPATSSVGLSLLAWTHAVLGKDAGVFWRKMRDQILTVAPGWSSAYGMFTKKEADVVLSYTTSPAYHIVEEKNDSITAMSFSAGHIQQIEGGAAIKASPRLKLAQQFLALLPSMEIQSKIPTTQWMYPVLQVGFELPRAFQELPRPAKVIRIPVKEADRKAWLKQWNEWMTGNSSSK